MTNGHLDNILSIGTFWCDFNKVSGSPYSDGYGWLQVIAADKINPVQIIYRYNNDGIKNIAVRFHTNGKWYPWRVITPSDNLYMLSGGTKIPANGDLNDYTTPGNYYSDDNPNNISNSPINYPFTLKIEYALGTSYPRQILMPYNNSELFVRLRHSTWSGWKKIQFVNHVS